ncbi:FHA domain-containing protein [Nocardia beijingensis]|uniref:FHA domain-containing protein n=1 Tax=Nocardia beijingensis TaxID=95162 RepID=UPI001894036A|nr:FHA domain-containing protein [Nocardia beijingensis]MBF6465879.1 FHA domain-containing protein [Nocardia beijingensis]
MSAQIEVLPGAHLVASASGAVVVVAHRGDGTVTADTVAARTMAALLDIVREAVARDRSRSGRAVARSATTWLMGLANGEEDEVEFGVVTPADNGLAVFLHGGITAVLADAGHTEVLRGRDAGFTVDRMVTPAPGTGAGLFVDEAGWTAESLPERGIFALGEGTAPGSGAVRWSGAVPEVHPAEPGAHGVGEPGRRPEAGSARQVPPAPRPVSAPEPQRIEEPQHVEPPSASTPHSVGAPPRQDSAAVAGSDAPQAPPSHRLEAEQASGAQPRSAPSLRKGQEPGDAATEVDLQAAARRAAPGPGVTPSVAQPTPPRPDRGPARPAHRTDRDQAIADDADLAETVVPSAEVVAAALGSTGSNTLGHRVIVHGFQCARRHHNDPRVSFCAVCGIRMDQLTCVLSEGVRPPLGVLLLDDGTSFVLDSDCVLGREPEYSEAVARGARPLRLEDTSGGMSRAHAEIRLVEWDVTVVDGGSTNGTHIRHPGRQEWVRAVPGRPVTLAPGAQIQLGGRVLTFDSPHGQL